MGALARELGLERRLLPAQQPTRPELLPHPPPARGRVPRGRARRTRSALGAPPAVAPARRHRGGGGRCWSWPPLAWWLSYAHNRAYLAEVAAQLRRGREAGGRRPRRCPERPVRAAADSEQRARRSPRRGAHPDGSVPWSWRFGLYQGGKLEAASQRRLPAHAAGHVPARRWRRISSRYLRARVRGRHGRGVRRAEDLPDALRPEALRYARRSGAGIETRRRPAPPGADAGRRRRSRPTSTRSTSAAGSIRPCPGTTTLIAQVRVGHRPRLAAPSASTSG